jgi:AAA domain
MVRRKSTLAFRNAAEANKAGCEFNNKGRQCRWMLYGAADKHCPNSVSQVQAIHCDKHLKEIADTTTAQIRNKAEAAEAVEREIQANRAVNLEVPEGRHELTRCVQTVEVKDKNETYSRQYLTQVTVINADEAPMEEIQWLYPNRIPKGAPSLYVGKPGNAKSLSVTDLAARKSSGAKFHECENPDPPMKVLMYAGEDPIKQVVIPRLVAAGADLKNMKLLDGKSFKVIDQEGNLIDKREIDLSQDIPVINQIALDYPDVGLIILDPITGVFGNKNTNRDDDMRPIVNELRDMCEKRNLTIVMVAHTNKKTDAAAIHQIQGCSSMAALPRAAWLFTRDPESDDQHAHMMTCIKGNWTDKKDGLKLYTKAVPVEGLKTEYPMVVWGESTSMQADDANQALKEKRETKADKRELAKTMILTLIGKEPMPSKDIYDALRGAGITDKTGERAAQDLTDDGLIIRRQKPGQKGWWMAVPEHADQFEFKEYRPDAKMQDVEVL